MILKGVELIFNWPPDKPVPEAIGEAIGAASMCWEFPEKAGQFKMEVAAEISEELLTFLKRKLWVDATA
jgi:hypothetical protein